MTDLLMYLPDEWHTSALAIAGICAFICTLLPAPVASSNTFYKVIYKVVNILGANIGKAKNADEADEMRRFR